MQWKLLQNPSIIDTVWSTPNFTAWKDLAPSLGLANIPNIQRVDFPRVAVLIFLLERKAYSEAEHSFVQSSSYFSWWSKAGRSRKLFTWQGGRLIVTTSYLRSVLLLSITSKYTLTSNLSFPRKWKVRGFGKRISRINTYCYRYMLLYATSGLVP